MADGHVAAEGPGDRILHFLLPGLVQGLAFWWISEGPSRQMVLELFSAGIALGVGPLTYFLTTVKGRRASAAVFALLMAAAAAGLAILSQVSRPGFTPDGTIVDLNPHAAAVSLLAAGLVVAIAVPLYRTAWERGRAFNHYPSLFEFAWSLPVVVLTAWLFTGGVWLLLLLMAALFDVVGIELLSDLLDEIWVVLPVTAGAFALGIGVLRGREGVVLAMRGLLLALVRVVAPIFAVAMAVFVVMLGVTGLEALDDTWSPVGMLFIAIIVGIVFYNGVLDASGPVPNRALVVTAGVIGIVLVALCAAAAYGLKLRLDAEGLTPPRIFAVILFVLIAAYSLVYAVAALAGGRWDVARQGNVAITLGVLALAVFVQTPLFQPEIWTAQSQEARLRAANAAEVDDLAYLAFEIGEPGRDVVRRLSEDESFADKRTRILADAALAAGSSSQYRRIFARKARPEAAPAREPVLVLPPTADLIDQGALVVRGEIDEALFTEILAQRLGFWPATTDSPYLLFRPEAADLALLAYRDKTRVQIEMIPLDAEGAPQGVFATTRKRFETEDAAKAFLQSARTGEFGLTEINVTVPVIAGEPVPPYAGRDGVPAPSIFSPAPDPAPVP
jgi:hypothetical protein